MKGKKKFLLLVEIFSELIIHLNILKNPHTKKLRVCLIYIPKTLF